MMPETMRERIARAIWERWRKSRHASEEASRLAWEDLRAADRDRFPGLASLVDLAFTEADDALDAMAEPTSGMLLAMQDASDGYDGFGGHWDQVYAALLAAAKEGK